MQLSCSCRFSSILYQLRSISLFLCCSVWRLNLVVVDSSFKIEEFHYRMAIFFSDLKELNSKTNLSLSIELIERSVLIIHSDSRIFWLIISPLVPLPPSKFLRAVTPPHYAYRISLSVLSKTRLQKEFSLFMWVLSHSDTHHLNRHMVGCGCNEILTQRSITALFFASFSLYLIQRWFWWLSYSNHSFQLRSIQYSDHHSHPPRNH